VEQLCEITHEMLLRGEVPSAEILDVSCIEGVKLQRFLQNPGGRKYSSQTADNEERYNDLAWDFQPPALVKAVLT